MASKQQQSTLPDKVKEAIDKYGEENILVLKAGTKTGYFLRVEAVKERRVLYSRALTAWSQDKILECGEIIFNTTFLDGDKEFRDTDSMEYLSACNTLSKSIGFLSVEQQSMSNA